MMICWLERPIVISISDWIQIAICIVAIFVPPISWWFNKRAHAKKHRYDCSMNVQHMIIRIEFSLDIASHYRNFDDTVFIELVSQFQNAVNDLYIIFGSKKFKVRILEAKIVCNELYDICTQKSVSAKSYDCLSSGLEKFKALIVDINEEYKIPTIFDDDVALKTTDVCDK